MPFQRSRKYYGLDNGSLESLAVLIDAIRNCADHVHTSDLGFVRPYCIAVLDQQFRFQKRGNLPCRAFGTQSPELNRYLKLFHFRHLDPAARLSSKYPSPRLMIALRRFNEPPIEVETAVEHWAKAEVLRHFPSLSARVEKSLIENFWEIMNNALVHSRSPEGISVCGQFYPKKNRLEMAFYDAGVGIPHNVREFLPSTVSWKDSTCIEWALHKGNSTRGSDVIGGIGLHVLKEFIAANGGALHIVSGHGVFRREGKAKPTLYELKRPVDGTLFNIVVNSDNLHYTFMGERV